MSSTVDTSLPSQESTPVVAQSAFANTADEAFFFPSDQHLRAFEFLGHVLWSTSWLAAVIAEPGCGKTLLVQRLLRYLDNRYIAAGVNDEKVTAREFLRQILHQYGIDMEGDDRSDLRRLLERYVNHQAGLGRTCVLIVENAQSMHPLVLEELRCLAALQVNGGRALKLLLLGSKGLDHVLDSPRMTETLGQRIPRYVLGGFSEDQTVAYIAHRLRAAGAGDPDALLPAALARQIHIHSRGIPAQINGVCEAAFAAAREQESTALTQDAVDTALDRLGLPRAQATAQATASVRSTSPQPDPAKLIVALQGAADRDVLLQGNRILIGRSELADIRIDSSFVSRYHALIVRDGLHDVLLDLGSTNGLTVGSHRVMRRVLRHRDLMQIGPARLTYINSAAAAEASIDGTETVCFARPGFSSVEDEQAGAGGTVVGFGR